MRAPRRGGLKEIQNIKARRKKRGGKRSTLAKKKTVQELNPQGNVIFQEKRKEKTKT